MTWLPVCLVWSWCGYCTKVCTSQWGTSALLVHLEFFIFLPWARTTSLCCPLFIYFGDIILPMLYKSNPAVQGFSIFLLIYFRKIYANSLLLPMLFTSNPPTVFSPSPLSPIHSRTKLKCQKSHYTASRIFMVLSFT